MVNFQTPLGHLPFNAHDGDDFFDTSRSGRWPPWWCGCTFGAFSYSKGGHPLATSFRPLEPSPRPPRLPRPPQPRQERSIGAETWFWLSFLCFLWRNQSIYSVLFGTLAIFFLIDCYCPSRYPGAFTESAMNGAESGSDPDSEKSGSGLVVSQPQIS